MIRCIHPIRLKVNRYDVKKGTIPVINNEKSQYMTIPCGKCIMCRIQKSNEWALRINHEADYYKEKIIFTTLTYNEENVPENYSLDKTDLQKFFKRLRKNYETMCKKNKTKGEKLKYLACGEYGSRRGRPHYHAVILGLNYENKEELALIKKSWTLGYTLDERPRNQEATATYVAKYTTKIDNGRLYYDKKIAKKVSKREPPFRLSSNGLGKRYCIKEKENLIANLYIRVGEYKKSIPRIYIRWLYKISEKAKDIQERIKNATLIKNIDSIQKMIKEGIKENILMRKRPIEEYADIYNHPAMWEQMMKNNRRKADDIILKIQMKMRLQKIKLKELIDENNKTMLYAMD